MFFLNFFLKKALPLTKYKLHFKLVTAKHLEQKFLSRNKVYIENIVIKLSSRRLIYTKLLYNSHV